MKLILVTLLLLIACNGNPSKPNVPDLGDSKWSFTGVMYYGPASDTLSTICADTLTIYISQYGKSISATTPDWHFQCGTAHSDTTSLNASGNWVSNGDSLSFQWRTDPVHPLCPSCWTFTTVGIVQDSIMRGVYHDFLGGSGTWEAVLTP